MTTQEALEAVFQNIVENAKIGCLGCSSERLSDQIFASIGTRPDIGDQTEAHNEGCHAAIEAAAEGMLAAVDSLQFLNIEGCGDCQDTAQFDAKATINRLREEAKRCSA